MKNILVGRQRVLLGMSGGMDSSMAAVILLEQGYEVIGATLLTHTDEHSDTIVAARQLADKLKIEHHIIDSRHDFTKEVIGYFADEYINGRTPSPCIRCNVAFKWKHLLKTAGELNCKYIATGHYVTKASINGRSYIKKGADPVKDQSYFLWNLSYNVLSKAIFPLGELHKHEVRELAQRLGYKKIAEQKESMGVCFLSGTDYRQYLTNLLSPDHPALVKGIVIDENKKTVGSHDGYPFYTIGQRRGVEGIEEGKCVIGINAEKRMLIIGNRESLYSGSVILKDYQITPDTNLWSGQKLFIRIRGLDSVPGYCGKVEITDQGLAVIFDSEVWALTPGQSIVIYNNEIVIGGGIM